MIEITPEIAARHEAAHCLVAIFFGHREGHP